VDGRAGAAAARRGLQVLWITPMRALAADTTRALQQPLPSWRRRLDGGPAHRRHAQRRTRAQDRACRRALVTTPESLSADAGANDARRTSWAACTP
jgi:ATP-dependent Lhr-like helicase